MSAPVAIPSRAEALGLADELLGDAHALVVGVSRYRHVAPLPTTFDAEDVVAALCDARTCAYHPARVHSLIEEDATCARLREELTALARRTTPSSSVLVYFSGHGGAAPGAASGAAEYYLLPVDARCGDLEALAGSALSGRELSQLLAAVPAARLTVVLDCCRAAGLVGELPSADGELEEAAAAGPLGDRLPAGALAALACGRGRAVLAASRRDGYAYTLPGQRNGLFTATLLEGLRGGAPGPGGVIRICDLFHYVQQQLVGKHRGQRPVFRAELEENFPIALSRGGAAAPLVLPAPPDELPYDAFVSYCADDADDTSWVEGVLVPRLEALGLRLCLESRDFRLGKSRVRELERAVTTSRYTLCVLSPAYLAGAFEAFCAELAQTVAVESRAPRLLPLLRRPCRPPLGTRMLELLDMSEATEVRHDAALARLAVALRQALG